MSSLVFLVPLALILGGAALGGFLWSLRSGQYEDLDGAAQRILFDEDLPLKDAAEARQRDSSITDRPSAN